MIKNITLPGICFFITSFSFAQVGIGTLVPETDLHVAGPMLVQEEFTVSTLPTVTATDEDFKLLTRISNADPQGEITELDVDSLTVAPINVVDYKFRQVYLDNLSDVNLQYDANRYVVGVANFRYIGDPVKKIPVNATTSIGAFVIRTFISNGQWHLEIRNRFLDLNPGDSLEYYVTLIVYDKSYYRNMPPIITNLGGSNRGTASSVPNLY